MKTAILLLMLENALSFRGLPYIYGANGGGAFDCSGLIREVLRSVGLIDDKDRTSQGLYYYLTKHKKQNVSIRPKLGDVVFYGKGPDKISHVAMVVDILEDVQERKYIVIEAGGGGRKTTTIEEARRTGACVRLRPMFSRNDVVAIVSPFRNDIDFIKL